MLFNSHFFIFIFLPVTLIGFYVIGRYANKRAAILWLVAASLFFYGWWSWAFAGMLVGSVLFNAYLGRFLIDRKPPKKIAKILLILGVSANLGLLGYFKYAGFITDNLNLLFEGGLSIGEIALPIAISFYTFQQIAFLVDAYRDRVPEFHLLDYFLFVTFFPQLIAGPIVHHQEIIPQYKNPEPVRFDIEKFATGLSVFLIGLFKKSVLADGSAEWADPVFAAAADGTVLTIAESWVGTLSFTCQLYFDFSGYSDMAIGLAYMLGIVLPVNFLSPLKSASIIEFWQQWHLTLTRFLTDYIYTPLAVGAARRQAMKNKGTASAGNMSLQVFASRVMWPTVITMFLAGLWHGAGYQFIAWGLLHGFYLSVNHAWRIISRNMGLVSESQSPLRKGVSVLITFCAILVSFIIFRAESVSSALEILQAMAGMNGISLGKSSAALFPGYIDQLADAGIVFGGLFSNDLLADVDFIWAWLLVLLTLIMAAPNTYELFRIQDRDRDREVTEPESEPLQATGPLKARAAALIIPWRASLLWALISGIIFLMSVLQLSNPVPFLYFQF